MAALDSDSVCIGCFKAGSEQKGRKRSEKEKKKKAVAEFVDKAGMDFGKVGEEQSRHRYGSSRYY